MKRVNDGYDVNFQTQNYELSERIVRQNLQNINPILHDGLHYFTCGDEEDLREVF